MNCLTVKENVECVFMTKKGCGFNGGACHTIVEQCEGCDRAREFATGTYCMNFPDPAIKWRRGNCNMATNIKVEEKVQGPKINPLKASKRAAR